MTSYYLNGLMYATNQKSNEESDPVLYLCAYKNVTF